MARVILMFLLRIGKNNFSEKLKMKSEKFAVCDGYFFKAKMFRYTEEYTIKP